MLYLVLKQAKSIKKKTFKSKQQFIYIKSFTYWKEPYSDHRIHNQSLLG